MATWGEGELTVKEVTGRILNLGDMGGGGAYCKRSHWEDIKPRRHGGELNAKTSSTRKRLGGY